MFDSICYNSIGTENKIELLKGAKPCHAKLFSIPKRHEETLKIEVNKLINIGVLKRKMISSGKLQIF